MSGSSKLLSGADWQHVWHRGTVFILLALILLCVLWELWVAPLRPGGSLLVLKVVPLLPAVPGVLRGKAFTFRWLSLVLWFYAAEGVTRALTDTGAAARGLGWIELLLSLMLFVCVAGFLRSGASVHDVR
ncbi:MAG: DUF2069 domain-containing protein [Thiomonas sp.]